MVKVNLERIKERIALACSRINRDPESVTIVCVSKGRGIEEIREAIEAGITDIAENKVQEAAVKYQELSTIKWHMIGHLQTNKVKEAVDIFDLIQSVDSLRLAKEIDKQSARINKMQDILIEINTSLEAAKFGLKPEESIEVIKEISKLKNINIKGLMAIAPMVDNPEKTRPYFRSLAELEDKINALSVTLKPLTVLSMGMSDDFEVAIEEGADMVRLGRAIFDA